MTTTDDQIPTDENTSPIICPFCSTTFRVPDDWCPHFIGLQGDLTLEDYKDFISGEYPAHTVLDADGHAFYFLDRGEGRSD